MAASRFKAPCECVTTDASRLASLPPGTRQIHQTGLLLSGTFFWTCKSYDDRCLGDPVILASVRASNCSRLRESDAGLVVVSCSCSSSKLQEAGAEKVVELAVPCYHVQIP